MILKTFLQRPVLFRKISFLLSFSLLAFTLPAWAGLGSNVASIKADQEKMNGSVQVTAMPNYQIHEIQSATGVKVREYVALNGTVFGVAWNGQFKPDLRQLLGQYFDQYAQAAQQNQKTSRGPATIQLPGLVVQTGGHQRAFVGRAYVPEMIPQGISAGAIK